MQKSNTKPIFCYVTDRASLPPPPPSDPFLPLISKITCAIAAGAHWVQIREKNLPASDTAKILRGALASVLVPEATSRNSQMPRTRILLNDRLDVAIAGNADGVHLGENSLPVAESKRLLQGLHKPLPEFMVGASCHSLTAAQTAESDGADYLFFGPIFATPSKAAFGEPQGLPRLREVCRAVKIPVLAIGGITAQNVAHCLDSGASGIAAIRLFQESSSLEEVFQQFR